MYPESRKDSNNQNKGTNAFKKGSNSCLLLQGLSKVLHKIGPFVTFIRLTFMKLCQHQKYLQEIKEI